MQRTILLQGSGPARRDGARHCSLGGEGTPYNRRLLPTIGVIAAPQSLYNPAFGLEGIDFDVMRSEVLGFTELVNRLGTDGPAGDRRRLHGRARAARGGRAVVSGSELSCERARVRAERRGALSRALDGFVAERKRLAAALEAGGDAAGATELAALRRPTTFGMDREPALVAGERSVSRSLLATAKRVRKGDREAIPLYRDALAATLLRKRAAAILADAGHGASETILRRVSTTLTALAATGGFEPDPAGTLSADRDPPGFEAVDPRPITASRPATPLAQSAGRQGTTRADAKARAAAEAAERAERERREAEGGAPARRAPSHRERSSAPRKRTRASATATSSARGGSSRTPRPRRPTCATASRALEQDLREFETRRSDGYSSVPRKMTLATVK
jgi:hypothetical protein